MPSDSGKMDRIEMALKDLLIEVRLGNQKLDSESEKIGELAKENKRINDRIGKSEERIGKLELAEARHEGAEKASEKTTKNAMEWLGIVFSVVGVLGSLIGGAWALFVRGEPK